MKLVEEIKEALSGHGHDCVCGDCVDHHHDETHGLDVAMIIRLVAAAALFAAGMIFEEKAALSTVLFALSALVAGYDVLIGAGANIIKRQLFDERLLMTIVCIAAFLVGEGGEGVSVMILYQLGELLQGYAIARSRRAVESLATAGSGRQDAEKVEKLLDDVKNDEGRKGRTEEFITRFARIYTPIILCLALIVVFILPVFFDVPFKDAVLRALVFLVIACPCAIVISVPLAYFAGIGGASRLDILFKNTNAMDAVAGTRAVIFSKEGTLTTGEPRISAVKSVKLDADTFIKMAAHAVAYSTTPVSECIKRSYGGAVYLELLDNFRETPGRGVQVALSGIELALGTEEFISSLGCGPGADGGVYGAVYVAVGGAYAGRITLTDSPRSESAAAVMSLTYDGGREVAMFAGDDPEQDEAFARSLGINNVFHQKLPGDRVAKITEMKSRVGKKGSLMFVGSRDEDAEALSAADVGVSVSGFDCEAAIMAADVVILDNSPVTIETAIRTARHTRSIVWQNIGFAVGAKALILVLGLFGISPLWLAVFADVGVALLAVINSLRAFFIRTEKVKPAA